MMIPKPSIVVHESKSYVPEKDRTTFIGIDLTHNGKQYESTVMVKHGENPQAALQKLFDSYYEFICNLPSQK